MARRKPRKNAGPQPHHNPKRASTSTSSSSGAAPAKPKRRPGEPHPPSLKGVAIRAAIVSGLFYPYLILVPKNTPVEALLITGIAFVLMMPLGVFMDRFRYKRQVIRWEERNGRSRPAKTPPPPPAPAASSPGSADGE